MDKEPEIMENKPSPMQNGASPFNKGLAIFFVIMSLMYTASPIDLAPDTIPVIGWLDDIGLLVTATMNAVQQFTVDQNSAMVKILKYAKWFMIIGIIIAVLLFGGLLAAIITLIANLAA